MNQQELEALVKKVAKEFSKDKGINITDYAINELVNPAIPHLGKVTNSLRTGEISTRVLEDTIKTILHNSLDIVSESGRNYIGFSDVRKSMRKECPYLFWC